MEENNLPPNENFYNLLGIENDADENAIKKAYRKKVLLCHPDKVPNNPEAKELFQQITKACVILLDRETRENYDCTLKVLT